MARPRVVVEGDVELRRELERILDNVQLLNEGAGAEAAKLVAERAYNQAPHRSGKLRDSIRTFATKRNAGIRIGFARTPYAGPVIGGHGSPGMPRRQGGWMAPPNPFPYDALDDRYTAVIGVYENFIDKAISGQRIRSESKYKRHETS